jgi:hypothetical protein
MFKSSVCNFVVLALLAGCSSLPPSATVVETKQPAFTNTPPIEVLVAITPTPTLSEAPIKNNILEPTVQKICPSNPEVPFSELGMTDTLALLTMSDNEYLGLLEFPLSTDVLSYSGARDIPEKLTEIRKGDRDGIIGLSLSPDGKWMEITRWNNDNQKPSLWVSTIDGQKQWKVKDLSRYQSAFWVKDNEILVTGSPYEKDYEGGVPFEDRIPMFQINPFTLETHNLTPLPDSSTYEYGSYTILNGHPYALYWDNGYYSNIYLYDYDAAKSTRIIQWIDFSNPTAGVVVNDNGLYDVALEKDGLEFATDLTLKQITETPNYDDVMKQIYMNGQKLAASSFSPIRNYYYVIPSEELVIPNASSFYLYDYKANVMKDYCLHLENEQGYIRVSPDEKFAYFEVRESPDSSHYYVLVLNLENGYHSIIPNSKAIGFWQKE